MTDPAAALVVSGRVQHGATDSGLRIAKAAAWLVALALHAALLWGWIKVSRWQPESVPQPIEVIFLARQAELEHEVPAMPVPPARPIRRVITPRAAPSEGPRLQAVEVPIEAEPLPDTPPSLRLWRPDGGMALPDAADSVPVFDDRARITRDRRVALPGSTDAAYAEKVALRLRRSFTPEDVVMAVLRFLGGGAQPDDCSKIEARLLASDPGVSREIDMDKFHRFCK